MYYEQHYTKIQCRSHYCTYCANGYGVVPVYDLCGQAVQYFSRKQEELRIAYEVITDAYLRSSEIVFDQMMDSPEVLALLHKASSTNEVIQTEARKALFNMLTPTYERLKKHNIRQFHFHLPDSTSFLRFHRPQKFGDNLSSVRASVVKANKELIPVFGFEEGRIYNGFRYVFPVIDQGIHLGSVEVSINFEAFSAELERLFSNSMPS